MASEPFVLKVLLDTPISLQGTTLGQYLGRKAARKAVKSGLGVDGQPAADEKKEGKMSETNPAVLKLALLNRIAKMAELDKEAPFKSEAQRRKFHAMAEKGEISKETVQKWESETPKDQALPERVREKSAQEKEAIAPLLAAGARLLPMIGRGLLSTGRVAAKGAKAMVFPTTKKQLAGGMAGWAGLSGVQGAAQHQPSQFMGPIRMASLKDRLVELTKQALEAHDHRPASSDVSDPDVKKKSLAKSSAVAKSLGISLGGKSSVTSAPSSPTSIGRKWLSKGKPGGVEHTMGDAPPVRQMSGKSMEEVASGGEGGGHILRPSI